MNRKTFLEQIVKFLPQRIRTYFDVLTEDHVAKLQEIRLRVGRPLNLTFGDADLFLGSSGLTTDPTRGEVIESDDVGQAILFLSNHSVYALEEELRQGFITVSGGHRVGFVGHGMIQDGKIKQIKNFSGLNFRITREIHGCANSILPYLINDEGEIHHTMIISPPRCGKTTLLRDLIYQISNGTNISSTCSSTGSSGSYAISDTPESNGAEEASNTYESNGTYKSKKSLRSINDDRGSHISNRSNRANETYDHLNLDNIPQFPGRKVGVVDERSELAGTYQGKHRHDLGIRTDVLDHCPKSEGMYLLIRSMSPEVIATDEIGSREDVAAIQEAVNAGIRMITTVHGRDLQELSARPILKNLLESKIFTRYVILDHKGHPGTIKGVYDEKFVKLEHPAQSRLTKERVQYG